MQHNHKTNKQTNLKQKRTNRRTNEHSPNPHLPRPLIMARMKLTAAGPEGLRVNERDTCCARVSVVVGAFERIVFPIETRFLSGLARLVRVSSHRHFSCTWFVYVG